MARATKPKAGRRTIQASATISGMGKISVTAEIFAAQEIDRIIARLDAEMPQAQKSMDELLARLRTTHSGIDGNRPARAALAARPQDT